MPDDNRDASRLLGPLGAEIMDVLWAEGDPLTVRQVLDRLNHGRDRPLAYTTVMTVLGRLADRGVLRRTPQGRGYVYEPLVPDVAAIAVRDVIDEFGDAAVAHFLDQANTDPQVRARLRKLLQEPS